MSLKIFSVIAAYWTISISLVFINKWLLTSRSTDMPDLPLFVTWCQCVITAVLCFFTSKVTETVPNLVRFPDLKFSPKTLVDILPLSVIFVAMVSSNNYSLKYLNVSFYYLARSLTTVFNVIFTFFILHIRTSRNALICCGFIMIGYASGLNLEGSLGSLSLPGLIFGVASSLSCALNSIYTAKSLPLVEGSVWRLTFYNNLNAVILLIPPIILTELNSLLQSHILLNVSFWFMLILSGLLGFAIGYVSALQIKVTSPLTHNVSGTAKAAAQTVLAVAAYREIKSFAWWLSNLVVLTASAAYTLVRHSEAKSDVDMLNKPETLEEEHHSKLTIV